MFLGENLIVYLVLAFGGALAVGNFLALVSTKEAPKAAGVVEDQDPRDGQAPLLEGSVLTLDRVEQEVAHSFIFEARLAHGGSIVAGDSQGWFSRRSVPRRLFVHKLTEPLSRFNRKRQHRLALFFIHSSFPLAAPPA